jgi:hypothetical protein
VDNPHLDASQHLVVLEHIAAHGEGARGLRVGDETTSLVAQHDDLVRLEDELRALAFG